MSDKNSFETSAQAPAADAGELQRVAADETARQGGSHAARAEDRPHAIGETADAPQGLAFDQARLAYSIIHALLEHTRVTSDLIALMAQVIDEETTKALTQTPYWSAYLDSRRAMERTRREVEEFAEVWTRLGGNAGPPSG